MDNLHRSVTAAAVDHNDPMRPDKSIQRACNIRRFIVRDDERCDIFDHGSSGCRHTRSATRAGYFCVQISKSPCDAVPIELRPRIGSTGGAHNSKPLVGLEEMGDYGSKALWL